MELLYLMLVLLGKHILTDGALIRRKREADIKLWPDGLIPYNIPDTYSSAEKTKLIDAMERWQEKTCIKFKPWSDELRNQTGEERYIKFYKGGSCFSRHGLYQTQPQTIGIGNNCMSMSTIIHELGHAIGMRHTMERVDRDYYIDIHYENVNQASRRNYDTTEMKGQTYQLYGTPYDYKSIMHYGPKAYSSNGQVVMVTKDPAYQNIIGAASDVSFYDVLYVNRAYKCADKCDNFYSCDNGGSIGGPDCRCICPEGYIGYFCEIPLPGYEKIISWTCEKYWTFAAGRCYRAYPTISFSFLQATNQCARFNAQLATFITDQDMEWMLPVISKQISLTSATSFWVGLQRNANEAAYRLNDGTLYDTSIMLIHEMGSSSQKGCVSTDGVSLRGVSCDKKIGRGFICMKNFDPACGGRFRLTERGIFIQSPGYPNEYPKRITCKYVLQTSTDRKIEMRFDHFDFEEVSSCGKTYLQVQTKNDIFDAGTKYCSAALNNKTVQSEGNLAVLTMVSEIAEPTTGFRAFVKAVPITQLPTQPPTSPSLLDSLQDLFNMDSDDSTDDSELEDGQSEFLERFWRLFRSTAVSNVL